MNSLIRDLVYQGYLKTDRIIDAFTKIKRFDFVPPDLEDESEANIPLPIGYGQTISQPLTVAFMFELLQPRPGDKILDIGSGSGWTTALLAHIVGDKGKIIAMERIPELCQFGEKNVKKYNFVKSGRAQFICADGTKGYVNEAPYQKILVSASADEAPRDLKKQLAVSGRMVISIKDSVWMLEKLPDGKFKEEEFPGFAFVPLISDS